MEPDVNELKRQWLADPVWDIEETEGYEKYREELRRFRLETEAVWEARRIEHLDAKADELGITGNRKLAQYILRLERRLEELSKQINDLSD